jgi:hypothetical protein
MISAKTVVGEAGLMILPNAIGFRQDETVFQPPSQWAG